MFFSEIRRVHSAALDTAAQHPSFKEISPSFETVQVKTASKRKKNARVEKIKSLLPGK